MIGASRVHVSDFRRVGVFRRAANLADELVDRFALRPPPWSTIDVCTVGPSCAAAASASSSDGKTCHRGETITVPRDVRAAGYSISAQGKAWISTGASPAILSRPRKRPQPDSFTKRRTGAGSRGDASVAVTVTVEGARTRASCLLRRCRDGAHRGDGNSSVAIIVSTVHCVSRRTQALYASSASS